MATINVSFQMDIEDLYAQVLFMQNGNKERAAQIMEDFFTDGVSHIIDFNKMTVQEKVFVLQGTVSNILIGACSNEEWEEREKQEEKKIIVPPEAIIRQMNGHNKSNF